MSDTAAISRSSRHSCQDDVDSNSDNGAAP